MATSTSTPHHEREAIADFTALIDINPKDPDGYCYRAKAYSKLHQFERALDDCNHALTLDQYNSSTYQMRAEIYASAGQYEKAIDDCNQVIGLTSKNQKKSDDFGLDVLESFPSVPIISETKSPA